MTVWMWMCIEWHLCIYIYTYIMSFYYHGNGPNMEARPPTTNHQKPCLAARATSRRTPCSTTWDGRFIGSIQQIVSCETFFGLANLGPSFCQICEKSRVSKFHLKSSPTTKRCRLVENQTISYIYIKAQSINSILFWKKPQVSSSPTIYNLSLGNSYLRAGDGDRVRPEAALQEMDWLVRLLGGLGF